MINNEFPSPASASIHNGDITIPQQIVASSAGALLTSLVVTPMDVVKIRLQSQVRPLAEGECFLFSNGLMDHLCRVCRNRAAGLGGAEPCEWFNRPGHFSGTLDAFIKIARIEGPRSLWSGLAPTMLSAIPATVFYFTLYDNLLYRLRDALNSDGGGTNHRNGGLLISAAPLFAGTVARTVAVSVVSPLELVRTKMQSERLSYGEMRAAIVRTVQFDGYSALWRGWTATIMRDIPFSAIYWSLYEYGKKRVLHIAQRQKTNFALSFACGALSGSVAALLTLPFDVAKTHQQITLGHVDAALAADKTKGHGPGKAKVANVFSVMRELVKNKGLSALFTGVVPRVARVAPACAVMIGSYEELKLFFARKNRDFGGNCSR